MNFDLLKGIRSWWVVATIVAVLAVTACGGPSDQNSGDVVESPQQSPGSSGDQQGQATGSGGQPSGPSPFAAANPCSAFPLVAGASPAGGFISQALGGPNLDTSGSPQSDFAEAVGKFSVEALEQIFDGNVTADCFFEATMGDEGVVWITLILPSAPPPGAGQAVGDAMAAMGATVVFSTTTAAGAFDLVGLEGLPAKAPGGSTSTGGLYFVTNDQGASLAVLMVGYEEDSGQSSPVVTSGEG